MADFIAEFRPKPNNDWVRVPSPVTIKSSGFVDDCGLKQHSDSKLRSGEFRDMDTSIRHVNELLAAKSFTPEENLRLLRSSVLTLIKRLLLSRPLKSIEGCISVVLEDDPNPLVVHLKEICENNNYDYLTEAATHASVKLTDAPMSEVPVDLDTRHLYPNAREGSYLPEDVHPRYLDFVPNERKSSFDSSYSSVASPYGNRSPDSTSTSPDHCQYEFLDLSEDCGAKARVSPLRRPEVEEVVGRRDSDEESGYTSSEKDDACVEDMGCVHGDAAFCPEEVDMSVDAEQVIVALDAEQVIVAPVESSVPENEVTPRIPVSPLDDAEASRCDDAIDEDDDDEELVIDLSVQPEDTPGAVESVSRDAHAQTGLVSGALNHSETEENKESMNMMIEEGCRVPTKEREHVKDDVDKVHDGCVAETASETDSQFSDRPSSTEPDNASTDSDMPATDSECPVDLTGDSKITKDNEGCVSRPLVSKPSRGLLCKKCFTFFPNSVAFVAHSIDAHGLFSCKFCCKTFTAKNNLKRHDRLHTGAKPYKCSQCDHSFARRDDLKAHHLRHDYSKPFRCSLCSKGYTDRACVKNHMAKEHGSKLMHVCPQCGESFDREDAFTLHKKSHPELRQYSCKTCSFIGTNNLMTLKHSLHHTHKLFSCRPCNAFFADPFDYTNHVRKHKRSAAFTSYICCFCDLCLPTYDQFVRHEYSHAHCKVHPCGYCSKQFKSKSLLHQHMLTHEYTKTASPVVKNDFEELPCEKEECKSDLTELWERENVPKIVKDPESHWNPGDAQNSASRKDVEGTPGYEEVLDLSMKRPSPQSKPSNECGDQYASSSSVLSAGPSGLPAVCAPRNGCPPESAGLSQAQILDGRELLSTSPIAADGNFCEKTFNVRVIPNRHDDVVRMVAKKHSQDNVPLSPEADENAGGKDQFLRKCSTKGDFRFNPYVRNKLFDFTSKFLAARGGEMRLGKAVTSKPKDYGNAMNTVEKSSLYRGATEHPLPTSWHSVSITKTESGDGSRIEVPQPNVVVGLCGKEITPNSHPLNGDDDGASTRSLLPTFIKSESFLESSVKPTPSTAVFTKPTFVSSQPGKDAHHMSGDSHKCEVCQESFATFPELENHSVNEHKRFLCEHCGKSFTARPNRDRHVRYHTGERPYKCDLCDMAFFRGDDLKYHRTTRHPSAQPFICNHCSTTFTWRKDLERHVRHFKCKAARG